MIELLTEPWTHPFMQRAFLVAIMAATVCVVVGIFVVLRGMAFIGDAIAHAIFPGVAIGFVLHINLSLTGAAAGIVTAVAIVLVSQNRRLKEDTVIGVFFAFAFGLGIVLVSSQQSYTGDLASFLFGQILALNDSDVITVAVASAALIFLTILIHKPLIAVSLDRETARAAGIPVVIIDIALYAMVTIAIVISLQAVGNILVLALLITPAASARMVTERLSTMAIAGIVLATVGSVVGLYISFYFQLAAGGLMVLVLTSFFALAWIFAPKHGLVVTIHKRLTVR